VNKTNESEIGTEAAKEKEGEKEAKQQYHY
jgi:hypothetical protein